MTVYSTRSEEEQNAQRNHAQAQDFPSLSIKIISSATCGNQANSFPGKVFFFYNLFLKFKRTTFRH